MADELKVYNVRYTLAHDIDGNEAGPKVHRVRALNPDYAKNLICAIYSVMPDSGSIVFREVLLFAS